MSTGHFVMNCKLKEEGLSRAQAMRVTAQVEHAARRAQRAGVVAGKNAVVIGRMQERIMKNMNPWINAKRGQNRGQNRGQGRGRGKGRGRGRGRGRGGRNGQNGRANENVEVGVGDGQGDRRQPRQPGPSAADQANENAFRDQQRRHKLRLNVLQDQRIQGFVGDVWPLGAAQSMSSYDFRKITVRAGRAQVKLIMPSCVFTKDGDIPISCVTQTKDARKYIARALPLFALLSLWTHSVKRLNGTDCVWTFEYTPDELSRPLIEQTGFKSFYTQ